MMILVAWHSYNCVMTVLQSQNMSQIYDTSDKSLSWQVYSSFCDRLQQARIRLRGWWIGISQSPSTAHITLSPTIKLLLMLEEAHCCRDSKKCLYFDKNKLSSCLFFLTLYHIFITNIL